MPPLARTINAPPGGSCRAALVAALDAAPPSGHELSLDCDPTIRASAAELEAVSAFVREAVANAIAYAFPVGRAGHVWVQVKTFEGRITVTVRDDGIGMPDLMDYDAGGRKVMMACARTLGGYARLASAPFGGGLASLVFRPSASA